jgi:sporulation protein YlmC with PRC-barrel domain
VYKKDRQEQRDVRIMIHISELRGKTVMSNDGQMLGIVENIIINPETGQLTKVKILPSDEVNLNAFELDQDKSIVLPFPGISSIKNVVVVKLDETTQTLLEEEDQIVEE